MHGVRRHTWSALMAAANFTATILSGCGNNTSTCAQAISISFPGGSSKTITQGQSVIITVTILNDCSEKGVTWNLTGPGALSKQDSCLWRIVISPMIPQDSPSSCYDSAMRKLVVLFIHFIACG